MLATITIGGQVFDGSDGPSSWAHAMIQPNAVTRNWGGPPDEFEFTAGSCGPFPPFPPGVEVRVTFADDDGSNPRPAFVGDTGRASSRMPNGWSHSYNCQGLKARGDRVTITSPDGSGDAGYNLTQDDPLYQPSRAGRTLGQMFTSVFEVPATVAQLAALGIGNFTPDGKLPATTAADFAALDVVPPKPEHFFGVGLFNQCEGKLEDYCPKHGLWVDPDGTIRCRDLTNLPPRTITLPSDIALGTDPAADGLAIDVDASECYSAYRLVGLDAKLLQRSLSAKGLTPAWSKVDEQGGGPNNDPPWTILDFTTPRDSAAQGTASNVTSTGITVQCDDPKQRWAAQYWPGVEGRVYLEMTKVLPGVVASASRVITSCSALSPGGTATVGWDAADPIDINQFDRFRIAGQASPRAVVGRLYNVTGIPDGYSLYPIFPIPTWWANLSSLQQINTPRAVVQYNGFHTGKPPFFEQSVGVQVDVENQQILLTQPAAQLSAPETVPYRYPVSIADGLPSDIIAALPVFGGTLEAYAPAGGGFSGLGYSMFGITRVRTLFVPEFTDRSQVAGYQKLAQVRQEVYRDPIFSVSVRHIDYPTAFDPLGDAYALQFVVPGCATQIDGIAIPCRSARLEWYAEPGLVHSVSYSCSNQRRPGGDDLYTHPAFAPSASGYGMGYGEPFAAGIDLAGAIGNLGSSVGSVAAQAGLQAPVAAITPAAMPSPLSIDPIMQAIPGAGSASDFDSPGGSDFGPDMGGDFDSPGTAPAPRRKSARQQQIDETKKASRAENAEKHRLAQAILNPPPAPTPEPAPVPGMPEPPVTSSSMTDFMLAQQAKQHGAAPKVEGVPGVKPAASSNPDEVTARSAPSADATDPARRLADSARPPRDDKPLTLRERRRRGVADQPEEDS